MNNEVIKAMNKVEKKRNFNKWWRKNGYIVLRIVLFPIWIGSICYEKYNIWANKREEWNEKRAKEILEYYIPRRAQWDKEKNIFYFFDNGYGWYFCSAKKFLKRKDYRFWKVNANTLCGGKMRNYLLEKFELEGFKKELASDCNYGDIDIYFVLK